MSRARSLKPGFFKNEDLAELPYEYRILFQGLWCEADRSGRMEDRPKRIKAAIFPYDSVDVDAGLNALQGGGFILRYEAGGQRFIQVLAFDRHQNPHCREPASSIPAPDQHSSCTVQGNAENSSGPADSLNPVPVTPNPIPASKQAPAAPSPAGLACKAMKAAGCIGVNPSHPELLAALEEGATPEILADTVREAIEAGRLKPFAWAIATVRGRLRDGVKELPEARAGPQRSAQPGKQVQALMALEAMKSGNRMAAGRDFDGAAEALPALAGPHAVR